MLRRTLTLAGALAWATAGPLLAAALWPVGVVATLAAVTAWAGTGAMLGVLLLTVRANHQLLRSLSGRIDGLVDAADDGGPPLSTDDLDDRLTSHAAALNGRLDAHRDELLSTLDARVLGLHATVRELGPELGPEPGPEPDPELGPELGPEPGPEPGA